MGYGSGDIAGNVVYAFLSTFVLIYLTNTVGLKSGIVGTLIAVSKLFDGVTDVFFGAMIDKTKTKMGKARPWMLYGYIGCAVTLIAIFAIPENIGKTAQYILVFYCVLSTERRVLHRKQYCVFRTDSADYEKQQRAGGNGIVPFYFCIFHQPADSVRYD